MHTVETLIVGGGVAGASLGCSLAERGAGRGVCLVDVDLWGKYSSSELNGGGVRCVFAEPVNIRLSLASVKYYRGLAGKLDYRERGYLWMYDEKLWGEARSFLPVVRGFGVGVEELGREALLRRYSVLGEVGDVAGGTFTAGDGRLSPHRLRMHYLERAQGGGVELMDRWVVVGVEEEKGKGWRVVMRRVGGRGVRKVLSEFGEVAGIGRGGQARRLTRRLSDESGSAREVGEELVVRARRVVNAAGPWAGRVATLYGRALPVRAVPRQVFLVEACGMDFEPLPFFIDYPQEMYFRYYEKDRKGCVLVSWSDPEEAEGIDFGARGAGYFEAFVRPRLARRVPGLAGAKVVGGWVGHYEMSADKMAVVGSVPGREGIFNYNGLSAHGVMQSRGIGEGLAEFLVSGRWGEIDLGELSEERFGRGGGVERMYV